MTSLNNFMRTRLDHLQTPSVLNNSINILSFFSSTVYPPTFSNSLTRSSTESFFGVEISRSFICVYRFPDLIILNSFPSEVHSLHDTKWDFRFSRYVLERALVRYSKILKFGAFVKTYLDYLVDIIYNQFRNEKLII